MIDFAIAECWTYRFHRWTLVAANGMWRAFVGWYGGFANLLIAFLQNFSNHKYFYNLNKYNFKFCQMHLICGMVQLLTYANGTYQRFKGTVVALCNACSVFRLRQMEHINTFRAVICNGETVKIQKDVQIALGIHYSMKKRDKWLRQVRELVLDFVPQIYLFAKEKNKEEGKGNK